MAQLAAVVGVAGQHSSAALFEPVLVRRVVAGSAFAVAVVCMTAVPQVVVRLVTAAAEQVLLSAILFVALVAEPAAAACRVVELEHWAAALGRAVVSSPWRE